MVSYKLLRSCLLLARCLHNPGMSLFLRLRLGAVRVGLRPPWFVVPRYRRMSYIYAYCICFFSRRSIFINVGMPFLWVRSLICTRFHALGRMWSIGCFILRTCYFSNTYNISCYKCYCLALSPYTKKAPFYRAFLLA